MKSTQRLGYEGYDVNGGVVHNKEERNKDLFILSLLKTLQYPYLPLVHSISLYFLFFSKSCSAVQSADQLSQHLKLSFC